jgi:NAD(P)-dependent dehydrogenase (short-subunit alcohol dehydrogenase family)
VADEINAAHGAGTAFAFPLDVTQEDQWIEALEKADEAMGGISVLVNNAGIAGDGRLESLEFGLWKKVMSVNVDSRLPGRQARAEIHARPPAGLDHQHQLDRRPDRQPQLAGLQRLQGGGLAAEQEHRPLLRQAGAGYPLQLDPPDLHRHPDPRPAAPAVRQGGGPRQAGRQVPLGRIGEPDDIANAVLYLASDESKFMTGAELKLDGGISAM